MKTGLTPDVGTDQLTLTIEDNDVTPVPALPLGGAMLLGLLLTLLGAVRVGQLPRRGVRQGQRQRLLALVVGVVKHRHVDRLLIVSDASTGLAVDVRVRTLVMHQAEGFRERGMAVSLSYNPTPQTPLGLTARVAPSWGGEATSGAEALWGRETMAGMAHGGVADGTRLDAEVGYGLPVGRRFVGTPRVGVSTSEYGRAYRLGYGLTVAQRGAMRVELGVDAQRRERPTQGGVDTGVLGRAALGW